MSGSPARRIITLSVLIAIVAILVPLSVSCSKPPLPTADFTYSYVSGQLLIADPIAGTAPLAVRFTDQSTGQITSWRWNLGDGTIVQGAGSDARDFTHIYNTANSSGYVVVLTVRGPGGKVDKEVVGLVTVLSCSEAANTELSEAKLAIQSLLSAAGRTALDAPATAWNGSRDDVTAGGMDAADYLRTWKTFKATYRVSQAGTIEYGTDVSWGCIEWTMSITGPRWRAKSS